MKYDIAIIGGGPAGLSAAITASSKGRKVVVFEAHGFSPRLRSVELITDYMGCPDISGNELMDRFIEHARHIGAEIIEEKIVSLKEKAGYFELGTPNSQYNADTVILATGISRSSLLPGEKEFLGRGVSYCATCDGFFFKGKDVLVIGGGDSALQEALFLTKFASRVRVVHRRDQFRAGEFLQQKATENAKIQPVFDTVLDRIDGEGKVQAVQARNVKTGALERWETDGVFVFVGHFPNSGLFKGQLDMDPQGFLVVDKYMMTNVPGVFAAGEIMDPIFKQAISSAGLGCMAAIAAERWLESREEKTAA